MADYNISSKLSQAMEKAIYIAEDLKMEKLSTCVVTLAILMDEENVIQEQYHKEGIVIYVSRLIYDLITNPELYEKVFEIAYPAEESDYREETEEAEEKVTDIVEKQNDDNKVTNVIYNITLSSDILVDNMPIYENIEHSDDLKFAFEDAYKRCLAAKVNYIDENNLLYAILNMTDNSAIRLFDYCNIDIEELKGMLLYNSEIYESYNGNNIKIPTSLETCCEIINNRYKKGDESEILERDNEIYKVWSIFSKKTKRNAILVGDAGVGKSAIVEAITLQIVNGKCPKEFRKYSVVSLDLTSMVAGTKYRGEFEQKVQTFIKFLQNNNKIIVFVDEIHQLFGAGGAEGSGPDLSGALKPILARDDVVFIGATTNVEYERYFTTDPAFKRRFEKVEIQEPKLSKVKNMVKAKVNSISKHHGISISDDILDYIIITAKAMNYEGNNPDLTVDLVDRAMAIAKMRRTKELSKKDVDKVYAGNYETFKKISKKNKKAIAYHEAGHALVRMLSKNETRSDVKVISIIPAADYLGVTISEENNTFAPITRKAVLESASMSIAGRVAQEFVDKEWDFGASSDLMSATKIIRRMIVENGMDDSIYTNISLYNLNNDNHNMSPEAVDRVNERIKEVMQKVYEDTKILLTKNKDKLDIIANLLMERGIISIKEVESAFKEKGIKLSK